MPQGEFQNSFSKASQQQKLVSTSNANVAANPRNTFSFSNTPQTKLGSDEKSFKNPYLNMKRESNLENREVQEPAIIGRESQLQEPAIMGRDSQLAIKNIKVYQPLQHSPVRDNVFDMKEYNLDDVKKEQQLQDQQQRTKSAMNNLDSARGRMLETSEPRSERKSRNASVSGTRISQQNLNESYNKVREMLLRQNQRIA